MKDGLKTILFFGLIFGGLSILCIMAFPVIMNLMTMWQNHVNTWMGVR